MVELVGPSMFSHWSPDGDPIAKPNPVASVQVTAVSMDQTENTTSLFQSMLPERTRQHYRMDVQKEIIYALGGQVKLKAIGSSFRAAEGSRTTFCVANETHHWVPSKHGDAFYRTISNNLTKVKGRLLCITNAFEPGEESVAEMIRLGQEKVWAGLAKPSGWLYDSLEAHPDAPLTEDWAPFIVNTIKGDAHWLDTEIIMQSLQDSSIPPSTHRRMWYNALVASEDSLFSAGEWDACLAEEKHGDKRDLSPGDEVVLGFDGGKTDDSTALVAIRLSDKLIVPLGVWQRPPGAKDWHVSESQVETEVHQAFATFKVRAAYFDVALWESFILEWGEAYRETLIIKAPNSALGFDMRGNQQRVARGNEAFVQTILDGRIKHNGDRMLRSHALNCKRRRNRYGLIFGKISAESDRKVDAYAATLLAFMAMNDLNDSGKTAKKEYNRRLFQF